MNKYRSREELYLDVLPEGGLGIEVGVWLGRNAKELLRLRRPRRLILVDLWKRFKCPTNHLVMKQAPELIEAQYLSLMHYFFNDPRVTLLRMASDEAASLLAPGSANWVYVDANHDYESVRRDLNAWSRALAPDGILAGHDWRVKKFSGVTRAVAEFCEREGFEMVGHTTDYFASYALKRRTT